MKHIKKRERKPKPIFAGKRPIKQRMWDYMRRNKIFKPMDIMTILDVKYNTVRSFLYPLMIAGMVQKKEQSKKIAHSVYVFTAKDNVIHAPMVNSREVYCYTSGISIDIGARNILKGALEYMSQGQIAEKLGVSKAAINLLVHNKYPSPAQMYKKIREIL